MWLYSSYHTQCDLLITPVCPATYSYTLSLVTGTQTVISIFMLDYLTACLHGVILALYVTGDASSYQSCEHKLHQVLFLLISSFLNAVSFCKLQKKAHFKFCSSGQEFVVLEQRWEHQWFFAFTWLIFAVRVTYDNLNNLYKNFVSPMVSQLIRLYSSLSNLIRH